MTLVLPSTLTVPKNWKPSAGERLGLSPLGIAQNLTSGPKVASSSPGPKVPAWSGPATNSQKGSKSVNLARDGS